MDMMEINEPAAVFNFFKQISGIPHGSGNIQKISDYLACFAKERGLFYIQDKIGNIIIVKEATQGYENELPIMLQGHMDMVAVKKPGVCLDMEKDGLVLQQEGDWLYAENTSLGGDDGIALAYGLAVLDAKDIPHPKLEVVFTVDEETGMDGARMLDVSALTASRMVNIDSEEEGIILAGCAGGARVEWTMPMELEEKGGQCCKVIVKGLLGGHSGVEIHKERGNALSILGRVLHGIAKLNGVYVEKVKGGHADNAIPWEAEAILVLHGLCLEEVKKKVAQIELVLQAEYKTKDPALLVSVEPIEQKRSHCLTKESGIRLIKLLHLAPNGVQAMSADMAGLVETSVNLGIVETVEDEVVFHFSVRSSLQGAKEDLEEKMESLASLAGAVQQVKSSYPGWSYEKKSPFREKAMVVFEKMYGYVPKVEAIHAGLECGLLIDKIKNLECISIGPNMKDIHTTEEKLSISSTKRVWKYLLGILETKD